MLPDDNEDGAGTAKTKSMYGDTAICVVCLFSGVYFSFVQVRFIVYHSGSRDQFKFGY